MTPKAGLSAREIPAISSQALLPPISPNNIQSTTVRLSVDTSSTKPIMVGLGPSNHDILISYRHLYRALLHAVQFSMPARFTARDQLRDAFRKGDPTTFNQEKIDRTIQFLNLAASETGLEHRIVKNLLRTNYERRQAYIL